MWPNLGLLTLLLAQAPPAKEALDLAKPVVCKDIRGYEDYDPRDGSVFSRDEKLQLYYRPLQYTEKPVGERRQIHLTQEGRIRKRGQKAVLWSKKDLLEYKISYVPPKKFPYLKNLVSLKELKPGEYDYDIILTDRLGGGTVTRTVPFEVAAPEKVETHEPKKGPARKGGPANPR